MVGVDIVSVERITKMRQKWGNKALERYLDEDEIALVGSDESAAGFWAAKEAISKALGCGIGEKCSFHDIRLHKSPSGAPTFRLAQHLIQEYAIKDVSLSITHDGGFAVAVAVIEGKNTEQDLGF
jgi:holo-[acyl-carrier protein] synthase